MTVAPVVDPRLRAEGDETALLSAFGDVVPASADAGTLAAVAQALRLTGSHRVRNVAALLLSDARSVELGPAVVEVLGRPGVMRQAGTLLFAMSEAGVPVPLALLARALEEGSHEARVEACDLIGQGLVSDVDLASEDVMRGVADRLRDAGGSDEAVLAGVAEQALRHPAPDPSPPRARRRP